MANIFQAKKTVNLSSSANVKQNAIEDQVASTAASTGNPWLIAGSAVLKATSAGYDAIQNSMDENGGSIIGNVGQAVMSPHKWVGKMIDHGWMGDDAWKRKKLSEANPDTVYDNTYAAGAGTALTRGAGEENKVVSHSLTGVTDKKDVGASLVQAGSYAGSALSKGLGEKTFKESMKDDFGGMFKKASEKIPDANSIDPNTGIDPLKVKNSIFGDQEKFKNYEFMISSNNIESVYNKNIIA